MYVRRLEGGHGGDKNHVNNEANSSLIFVASRVTRDTLALFPPYPYKQQTVGRGSTYLHFRPSSTSSSGVLER